MSCGDRLLTLFPLGGASLIFSDGEFNLYNVILFKKMADDFKTQARKKKYVVHYCYYYTGRACRTPAAHMPAFWCSPWWTLHPVLLFRWTVREYKFDAKAVEAGKEDLKKFESKRVKQKVHNAPPPARFFLVEVR